MHWDVSKLAELYRCKDNMAEIDIGDIRRPRVWIASSSRWSTASPPRSKRQAKALQAITASVKRGRDMAEDGIVIVDQHAAHERLVYERMKDAMRGKGVERQALLIPDIVDLGEGDCARVLARKEELAEMGLIIEAFGTGAVAVRETPALLGEMDVQGLIRDLADDLSEYDEALSLKEKFEHVCGTMEIDGPRDERAPKANGSYAP